MIDKLYDFLSKNISDIYTYESLNILSNKKICMNLSLYIQKIKSLSDEEITSWIKLFLKLLSVFKKYNIFCIMFLDRTLISEEYNKLNNEQIKNEISHHEEKIEGIYDNMIHNRSIYDDNTIREEYINIYERLKDLKKQNIKPDIYANIVIELVRFYNYPLIDIGYVSPEKRFEYMIGISDYMGCDYIVDNDHKYLYYGKTLIYNLDFYKEDFVYLNSSIIKRKLLLTNRQFSDFYALIDQISKNMKERQIIYNYVKDSIDINNMKKMIRMLSIENIREKYKYPLKKTEKFRNNILNLNISKLHNKYKINYLNTNKYQKIISRIKFGKIRFNSLLKYICKNRVYKKDKLEEIKNIINDRDDDDALTICKLNYKFD